MIGYCCVSLGAKSKFKIVRLTSIKTERNPKEKLFKLFKHNLSELERIIQYNISNNIFVYRISSTLFPLWDYEPYSNYFDEFCDDTNNVTSVKKAISTYLKLGGRLSTHPSQFCVISSQKEQTNINSIKHLEAHAKMLDVFGLPCSHITPINIHISNGTRVNDATISTVKSNINKLSNSVKNRLVFENEDTGGWKVEIIQKHFDLPITFDYHHHRCNHNIPHIEAIDIAAKTWKGITPLFHISSGKTSQTDRTHADYLIDEDVDYLLKQKYDWDIEAKAKDLAVFKIIS